MSPIESVLSSEHIRQLTKAANAGEGRVLQSLWSGYGHISRHTLCGADHESLIIKHIQLKPHRNHQRGRSPDRGHRRKLKSYQVERYWYEHFNAMLPPQIRTARCYHVAERDQEIMLILEDLDDAGFNIRHSRLSPEEMTACIEWLAAFHAFFLGQPPTGLWSTGTYWHLSTRPDELNALTDTALKKAAGAIDRALNASPFQTLVHGDAKLENFCFSQTGDVAVVDFQYTGGGIGMKDLAYFAGSCLSEHESQAHEVWILDTYFASFRRHAVKYGKECDLRALEENWRGLYAFAWADFHRFLKGWSPGHWKINGYSERVCRHVIGQIQRELKPHGI